MTGGLVYVVGNQISNTSDQLLYKSCRFGQFSYRFNTPNGTRKVRLKFAEPYYNSLGNRVFDVKINGSIVLSNFDIIKQAGEKFKAIDYEFDIPVTNGEVNIEFIKRIENPMINAIEIY
jgi:hypothetical protein